MLPRPASIRAIDPKAPLHRIDAQIMEIIQSFFTLMTLVKMGIVVVFTVGLSVLAEAVSPKVAGILSGFPLGAAVSLFFIGLEIDASFASKSALHTSAGLVTTIAFAYCYFATSRRVSRMRPVLQIPLACLGGIMGFFAAALLLSRVPRSLTLALFLPAAAIVATIPLFRNIEDVKIGKRVRMSFNMLLLRSVFAAVTIVLIIASARMVGPAWAGLFSAFPSVVLPLVAIIHFTYGPQHAFTIVKNVPRGLASLICYCITVSLAYPVYGVYSGTLMAYGAAAVYLLLIQFGTNFIAAVRPAAAKRGG